MLAGGERNGIGRRGKNSGRREKVRQNIGRRKNQHDKGERSMV